MKHDRSILAIANGNTESLRGAELTVYHKGRP